MKRLSIPEILEQLEGKSKEEKTQLLIENDTRALRQILYLAFSKDVKINLPDERPELKLKSIPEGLGESSLYQQARKLRIFIEGTGYDHLSDLKRETIFIQIIESLSSSEAELVLQLLIDKKIKSSLEYSDVSSSLPGLLPEIKKSKKPKKKPEPVVEEVKEEPEPVVEEVKEEPESYKNMSEFYEKHRKDNKKSKNKKSSKKKSK